MKHSHSINPSGNHKETNRQEFTNCTARCSLHRRLKLCQQHPVMCPLNFWLQPASRLIFAPAPVDPSLYNEANKHYAWQNRTTVAHTTSNWQVPTESCAMKPPNGATSYGNSWTKTENMRVTGTMCDSTSSWTWQQKTWRSRTHEEESRIICLSKSRATEVILLGPKDCLLGTKCYKQEKVMHW